MRKKENKYLNHVLWPQDFCEQDKVYQISDCNVINAMKTCNNDS